jgi:16S rRNA (adenine1518-N6/adenine1519-N6)-dimethyltransferase
MAFAKKSLGQHFLISKRVVSLMTESAEIKKGDQVIEIGPGRGILTQALIEKGATVIAFEKDDSLIPFLIECFKKEIAQKKLRLIHGDILQIKNWSNEDWQKNVDGEYKVVANVPYYLTGLLFPLFLENTKQPKKISFLVQKEVAWRITARDKKESLLSISVKCYGKPKYNGLVKRGLFRPIPKVDSAIITVSDISKKFFNDMGEKEFFAFLKKGFAHKRKLLKNNTGLHSSIFAKCGLAENLRAEDLCTENWKCLFKAR